MKSYLSLLLAGLFLLATLPSASATNAPICNSEVNKCGSRRG